ncbi:MAG: EamA/RhaT family transporter [Chloroflexi bacterium]|nr:MAG: EamA/RhaT family transporter [Chloroflexota bacterium]
MKAYLILFIGVLSVSFAAIFIRLADAPPLVIAACRLAIASIILIPIAATKSRQSLNKLSRHDIFLILLSSVFVALHFGLWITSLSYTSIASSVVLVTVHPAFVAVISYSLWGERVDKLTMGGIVVAFIGVVFINYSGFIFGSRAILGDLLALIAGFSMGAYLIIGRQLRARIHLLSYLAILYTCSAIILLVATVLFGYSFFGYSTTTYIMLILLALVPQLIGHSSLNLALRLIPVTFVSVAILGEPIGATLLGYFILGEIPTINEIAGGLLILSGIFLVMRQKPGIG